MKIVVISDTHGEHENLGSLEGDVLIHCGDIGFGGNDSLYALERLDAWFKAQSFKLILCTGGNHDFGLEDASRNGGQLFENAIYLEDQAVVFEGIKFYGAPWIPELRFWAFFKDEQAMAKKWASIPEDTDVLLTHTPPHGLLDRTSNGKHCGCRALRDRIDQLNLKLHCFGHIHASAGMASNGSTHLINAAMVDKSYKIVRRPFEFNISHENTLA